MAEKKKDRFASGQDKYRFEVNRAKVIASNDKCALCGQYVNKDLKYPHPMSATVDHIIPIDKGGTSELSNLQLAHWICNRLKSNKTYMPMAKPKTANGFRNLPHLRDWTTYRCQDE